MTVIILLATQICSKCVEMTMYDIELQKNNIKAKIITLLAQDPYFDNERCTYVFE